MSNETPEERPVVAPKKKLKTFPLIPAAHFNKVAASKPGNVVQWFSTDPSHRNYYGNYIEDRYIGDPANGYLQVKGWVPLQKSKTKRVATRDDQGEGVDNFVRDGDLIGMEISEEEHEKYMFIKRNSADKRTAFLTKPRFEHQKSQASVHVTASISEADFKGE